MVRSTVIALATLVVSGFASAELPSFKHVGRIDLFEAFNPLGKDVGENPMDLAYDSVNDILYVSGVKASAGNGRVGVLKVADPFGTPAFSTFAFVDNVAGGYRESRIELLNDNLYFGYGLGQTDPTVSGIRKYDLNGAQDLTFGEINVGDGDPQGVLNPNEIGGTIGQRTETFTIDPFVPNTLAALNRARGFIFRFSAITGANTANGVFDVLGSTSGWRDLDFDGSGGVYTKRENQLFYSPRNSANSFGDANNLFVNLQSLPNSGWTTCQFVPATTLYDACVLFNTRTAGALWAGYVGLNGQPVTNVGAYDEPVNKLNGSEPIAGWTDPPTAWTNQLLNFKSVTRNGKNYVLVLLGGGGQKIDIYELGGPTKPISGTLDLGLVDATWAAGKVLSYELRSGASVVDSGTFSCDTSFQFTINTSAPAGTYELWIKGVPFLGKVTAGVAPGATGLMVTLTNGDVDGDNAVTVFDYNLLSNAFDSVQGDPNWLADADLDGDGAVTVFDYSILSQNFDMSGDF